MRSQALDKLMSYIKPSLSIFVFLYVFIAINVACKDSISIDPTVGEETNSGARIKETPAPDLTALI